MREASESYSFTFGTDILHVSQIVKHLNIQKGDKILEIGCNKGLLMQKLKEQGVDVVGIDVNEKAVQKKVVEEVYKMDATNLVFPPASFDKIYSAHTIEHIPNLKKAFEEMDRVVKPGGRIVLIYPAELIRGITVAVRALVVYGNPLAARKIHLHKLNPKEIQKHIQGTGLTHIESHFPVDFLPQYLTVLEKK